MISILFLLGLAQASDVYEICVNNKQQWSDRYQKWETTKTDTFYSLERPQIIIHKTSFELNRDSRPIIDSYEKDGMSCWREHENSEICYNSSTNKLSWELYKKNGDVVRDYMTVCILNGEVP